mmetsp:Transcript_1218/g.2398  ORF Transcript_1218/g.2398 Transcript_1218/m.2398 type:complete len:372 (+) Transcript_1218:187-1302(+)
MCQPQPLTSCLTIKANASLRRSRQWKDQSENLNTNNAPTTKTTVPPAKTTTPKKNTRRKRRPTKKEQKQQQLESDCCDTSSTASTSPSSDESISSNSKQLKKSNSTQRRKRSNKSNKKTRPKIVNIISAPAVSAEEKANYIALDCEMVGIGPGGYQSRLARVSLVNWDGETVYDALVQVVEKVTDYRTFVSGITEEDLLSDEAVTFDEAQSAVTILLQDKILVGHGLKNDFHVLGLTHPWYAIRDTAKYEPFMKAVDPSSNPTGATHIPKKLKVLAKDKLGMLIQEEGKPHSPEEDAMAALELYKKHRGKWEKAMSWKVERTKTIALSGLGHHSMLHIATLDEMDAICNSRGSSKLDRCVGHGGESALVED